MTTERRSFTLDQHAISMFIRSQAGSLQKAILEAVANALDAGSSHVKVDLGAKRVVIEDDGRGFKSKKELVQFFERFGFDHTGLDRKVGRFGVGRGQLFHFGKNLWTTHGFTMLVDTQTDMGAYDLGVAKNRHKGVKIEIDLYSPLAFSEMSQVENELKKLVKFSTIPVILNGKEVQRSPQDMKWDAETDEAWFKLDDSYDIKIYSQGLFVQSLPARHFGKGGIVVTKLGQALEQNMARNDILTTDCEVWKKVQATLKELSRTMKKEVRRGATMNEAVRASMATDAIASNDLEGFQTLHTAPLFTLTNGRHVRLEALLKLGFVAWAPNKDPAADVLLQRKQANIINPKTLDRFQVETVAELKEKISNALDHYLVLMEEMYYRGNTGKVLDLKGKLEACVFEERVADLPMKANVDLVEVKDSEANPEEKLALSIIRTELLPYLTALVRNHMKSDQPREHFQCLRSPPRRVQMAICEGSDACTDGASKIWLDRKFLRDCIQTGPQGFNRLANVLTHELIHDVDSTTGHDHDIDFYQAFHDLTCDGQVAGNGLHAYRKWLRRGGKASMYSIKEMEKAELMDPKDTEERMAALADPNGHAEILEAELIAQAAGHSEEKAKPRKGMRP